MCLIELKSWPQVGLFLRLNTAVRSKIYQILSTQSI